MKLGALLAVLLLYGCGGGDDSTGPTPPPGALRFSSISAGYAHTCALASSGSAYCWGGNDAGTLGDGTRTTRSAPAAVAGGGFRELDAGAGHNCALGADGRAYCWGHNDEGQLGDGSFTDRDRPVAAGGNLRFIRISAGHAHSCALTSEGEAWCWGDDSRGQLGNGNDAGGKSAVPVRVLGTQSFASVHAGYYESCALTVAGEAYCWGANDSGQIGDGGTTGRQEPVRVAGTRRFSELSTGDRFVCGLSDGATWCWGADRQGELGGVASSVPVRVGGLPAFLALSAASGSSTIPTSEPYGCGIAGNHVAWCWGGAVRALRPRGDPAALGNRPAANAVAAGAQHVCVLDRSGYAWCGGGNYSGQLGDGTLVDRAQLVPVAPPPQ